MKVKSKNWTKKATGHHKVWGKFQNKKKGVKAKSLNENTVPPQDGPNRADADLGNLLSR